jgi:LysR family transcriptional regulator, mexEF-oprN operon transcriptional activator
MLIILIKFVFHLGFPNRNNLSLLPFSSGAFMPARPSIDYELLTAFDALMELRSVSQAAAALGVTQSAVSKRLSRLRTVFHDELFLRHADGISPTVRAQELADSVRRALRELQQLLAPHEKAPRPIRRVFRITGNDLVAARVLPVLVPHLLSVAPQARLAWRNHERTSVADALQRGDADLAVSVLPDPPSDLRKTELMPDSLVCLVREKHPTIKRQLSLETFTQATHLLTTSVGDFHGIVDRLLEERGLRRHVAISLPHYLSAPQIVANSDLLATLPASLVHMLAWPGVRKMIFPLPNIHFHETLYWHKRSESDEEVMWLKRELISLFVEA